MHRFLCFALFLTTCTLVGCGGGGAKGGKPVFPASGTVTMFGGPLADATVAFAPQTGQPTAVGRTDKEGNFTLTTYEFGDGAAEGRFSVVISKASAAASGPAGSAGNEEHGADFVDKAAAGHAAKGAGAGSAASMVPEQYTNAKDTPLKVEVKSSGENVYALEIK